MTTRCTLSVSDKAVMGKWGSSGAVRERAGFGEQIQGEDKGGLPVQRG